MQTFYKMNQKHAREHQVLYCMWVFIYKINKHDYLQKCKARLVICENQQTCEDLSIRAIILVSMMFWALINIITKFNLKTIQINIVNAFMNYQLNEIIYMRQSSDFETENMIFWLRKMLYKLKQFLLLWQKKLISTFKNLKFKKIS